MCSPLTEAKRPYIQAGTVGQPEVEVIRTRKNWRDAELKRFVKTFANNAFESSL